MLSSFLHAGLISCPKDCLNYQNQHWALQQRRLSKVWQGFQRWTTTQYRRFAGLRATTQGLIILLAIFIFSPKWVPQIVILLKAFHGQ